MEMLLGLLGQHRSGDPAPGCSEYNNYLRHACWHDFSWKTATFSAVFPKKRATRPYQHAHVLGSDLFIVLGAGAMAAYAMTANMMDAVFMHDHKTNPAHTHTQTHTTPFKLFQQSETLIPTHIPTFDLCTSQL